MPTLIEKEELRNRIRVFTDRSEAGGQLAAMLRETVGPGALVLAIPSGGVPVGLAVAESLALDFDLVLVRKVQIPWNTEVGFGAVNMDEDLLTNKPLLSMLNLSSEQIKRQAQTAMATIKQRDRKFRQNRTFPDINTREIVLVDDGLASGYTMRAAITYIRKRNPGPITVAVPTGSAATVKMLLNEVDRICCLNIREFYPFAVASAYRNWYDLKDDDVLRLIASRK